MNLKDFQPSASGRLVSIGSGQHAFVPDLLPPKFDYDSEVANALADAALALGNLNGVASDLPNPELFVNYFVKREAVLSSQIEGSRATVYDLFMAQRALFDELEDFAREPELQEVFNYVKALREGIKLLEVLPVSLRFIRDLHERLLRHGVRGERGAPGEFRRIQNRIGGSDLSDAFFVPPPVPEMDQALDAFERYLHDTVDQTHPLIRLALVHYQFEAIHPFLDGNGRVGRILIALLLVHWGLLAGPFLYLSAFFNQNRNQYYDLLLAVSQRGAWKEWILFFMRGIKEQALDAIRRANELMSLRESWKKRLVDARVSAKVVRLMELLFEISPALTIPYAQTFLGLSSYRGAQLVVQKLIEHDILKEFRGKSRAKIFLAPQIIRLID